MRLRVAWFLVGLLVFVACGREGAPIAQEALITCHKDGSTTVHTPVVQTQRDGVHVRVRNFSGESASLSGLIPEATVGTSVAVTSNVGPGRVGTACWLHSQHLGKAEPERLTLVVIDPGGYWRAAECPDIGRKAGDLRQVSIYDYGVGPDGLLRGSSSDPVRIVRRQFKPRATDIVEVVGYADAENPVVRVSRDGKVTKVVRLIRPNGGGLLVSGDSEC